MPWKRLAAIVAGANVLAIFAVAIWFRLFSLETIPFHNCDESYIGLQGLRLLRGEPFQFVTTSGNLVDPFLVAMQIPLHLLFRPSLLTLRIPAAVSGLLAVALTFMLGRKVLDRGTALLAATLFVSLPIAIVFSRHGLEYSQTPLVGVIAAYAAFRGKGPAAWLALVAGLLVHPTNIFLIPLFLPVYLTKALSDRWGDRVGIARLLIGTALALAAVVIPFALWVRGNPNVEAFANEPRSPILLLRTFGRFLFNMLSADAATKRWHDWAFLIGSAVLLSVGVPRLVLDRRWDRLALLVGLVLGLAVFDLKAGARVLDTMSFRYGAVFIAPAVLAAACLIAAIVPHGIERRTARRVGFVLAMSLGWIGIEHFWSQHLRAYTAGGVDSLARFRSHDAFRQAVDYLRRDARDSGARADGTGRRVVLAQDLFLNGVQLEYLAHDEKRLEVKPLITLYDVWRRTQDPKAFEIQQKALRETLENGGYAVQLDASDPARGGGLIEATLKEAYAADAIQSWRTDAGGGQTLTVFHLKRDRIAAGGERLRR